MLITYRIARSIEGHIGKVGVINLEIKMKNLFKGLFNRKRQKEEKDKITPAANIKCKQCGMQFQSKDNLEVHKKKAHSGKGEKKKKA